MKLAVLLLALVACDSARADFDHMVSDHSTPRTTVFKNAGPPTVGVGAWALYRFTYRGQAASLLAVVASKAPCGAWLVLAAQDSAQRLFFAQCQPLDADGNLDLQAKPTVAAVSTDGHRFVAKHLSARDFETVFAHGILEAADKTTVRSHADVTVPAGTFLGCDIADNATSTATSTAVPFAHLVRSTAPRTLVELLDFGYTGGEALLPKLELPRM